MRNLYLLLVISVFVFSEMKAQPNHYVLKVENAPYTELSGAIPLSQMVFATGDPFEVKSLFGETFKLFNKSMTMDTVTKGVLIYPNAFIEIIEDNNFIICDALLRYLDSIDNTSEISYKIEGTSGNKILKVQWRNLKIRTGQAGNFVNLQIWLYQKDGTIEYRYGPSSANNASGYVQATGPSVGISYSTQTFSAIYEKIWIYGTPPAILIDSAKNGNFPNIWGVPANGTNYRFIPKSSLVVSGLNNLPQFNIYPNPASEEIRISDVKNPCSSCVLSLYDINGQFVKKYNYDTSLKELVIHTKDIAAGIYSLHFEIDGVIIQQLITIQH